MSFLAGLKVEDREARWRHSLTAPEVAPGERVILVAEDAGAVVGFVAAGHARGDDEFGMGEVYAINVDPPAWGRGAGRALLAAATAWLDARFAVSILWVVDGNQRARALSTSARAGQLDGATKTESYGGADVNNCRYRRAARRGRAQSLRRGATRSHAGVRHARQRSAGEVVRHHDGRGPPPACP